jgi:hypothetical protein
VRFAVCEIVIQFALRGGRGEVELASDLHYDAAPD